MAKMMNVPILGIVENMSVYVCPDCGKAHRIFGDANGEEIAKEVGTELLASLPIDPKTPALADKGAIELSDMTEFLPIAKKLIAE